MSPLWPTMLAKNKYPRSLCLFYRSILRGLFMAPALVAASLLLTTGAWAGKNASDQPAPTVKNVKEPEHKQVVIVGGGIAGLTAAYFLKNRDIVLLEKSDHFGGNVASGSFGGFNYPKGPAYIGRPPGPIETMANEMALEPVEIPEPSEGFYYDGRFYFGTKGMAELLTEKSSSEEYNRFVSTVKKLSKIYEDSDYSVLPSELGELDKISAKEWFEKEKFSPIFVEIYESQARGVFGAGLGQISALSFIPEIGFQFEPSVSDQEENDSDQNEANRAVEKESGAFTFNNGLSELSEAIAKKLGNNARLDCDVTNVKSKENFFEIYYTDKTGWEHSIEADAVIIATPAPVALAIGKGVLNDEQKKILETINYCSCTTVALFCSSPIFDKSFNLGVGNGFLFTDLYDSSWVQRAYDADLNKVQERALCAYIPGCRREDDPLKGLSDNDLVKKIIADLEKIFPGAGSKVVGHDVQRMELAYPIMRSGAYESLARLNDINQGKVLLTGDYMIYPTLEAAAESGYLAANKMDATLSGEQPVGKRPKP